MSYWVREIAGWVLIVIGLCAFYQAYDMLMRKRVFEAAPMTFIGFVVFRGGIHLLKVAVAAQAARGLVNTVTQPPRRPRAAAKPIGPTPAKTVLPGPQHTRPPRDAAGAGRGVHRARE
ncbi:MAG: hypothetical protein JWO38_6469 [Gemmataceae bacterium]|nr:hypothetical protein [Gemmataceae bacterium]